MRIAFVTEHDFAAPSELHVLGFAQQLVARGHDVAISIGGDPASLEREGFAPAGGIRLIAHRFVGPRLIAGARRALRAFAPDLVHAWNARPPVLMAARDYARVTGAPLVVHFEDDEFTPWPLRLDSALSRTASRLRHRLWRFYPPLWPLTDTPNLELARREAAGFDALTPELAAEVEAQLGRPCAVVLPVLPRLASADVQGRSALPPANGTRTALFTGRVYTSAIPDIALAIDAVAAARRRGVDVRLVQTGAIEPGFDLPAYAAGRGLEHGAFLSLGRLPYPDVLATLRAADVLVQPGPPSRFNRLRLPSKLQSYLVSGTPTITFGVGFGQLLEAGTEALTTQSGDAGELADRLVDVLTDEPLRERLRAGGPVAAARLFDPDRNTQALLDHYEACLGGGR